MPSFNSIEIKYIYYVKIKIDPMKVKQDTTMTHIVFFILSLKIPLDLTPS